MKDNKDVLNVCYHAIYFPRDKSNTGQIYLNLLQKTLEVRSFIVTNLPTSKEILWKRNIRDDQIKQSVKNKGN